VDSETGVEAAVRVGLADRYVIERELGRGGMATVYLARDTRLDRRVAIKVMLPDVSASVSAERFLREVQVAAQLNHPHVLGLHDSGRLSRVSNGDTSGAELLYYVMPYVEGESLRDRLRRDGPLPLSDALRIASEVADALSFAHSRGVIHRDIKPENILLAAHSSVDRSHWRAMVADFGIARVLGDGGQGLTLTGVSVGTPAYMSPEQASGDRTIDSRADLYSLGCVLYEMLVGEPPFTGPNAATIVARHLSAPVPSIRMVRPSVPADVQTLVGRALEKLAADRIADAATFKASVDRIRARVETEGERANDLVGPPSPAANARTAGRSPALAVRFSHSARIWRPRGRVPLAVPRVPARRPTRRATEGGSIAAALPCSRSGWLATRATSIWPTHQPTTSCPRCRASGIFGCWRDRRSRRSATPIGRPLMLAERLPQDPWSRKRFATAATRSRLTLGSSTPIPANRCGATGWLGLRVTWQESRTPSRERSLGVSQSTRQSRLVARCRVGANRPSTGRRMTRICAACTSPAGQ